MNNEKQYRTESHRPVETSNETMSLFQNGIAAATEVGAREFVTWVKRNPNVPVAMKVEMVGLFTDFIKEKDKGRLGR